jgi:filamentous hemagglutinin family protein
VRLCLPAMRTLHGNIERVKPYFSLAIPLIILIAFSSKPGVGHAQVTTSITATSGPGSLGTSVTPSGNVYNITGGTRPQDGTNLFHSFANFSIAALDTAKFQNTTPEFTTSNIMGRVTGGNPSILFGTIDTLSYPGANLFLMNPAGIVFGPNATLNVGGSVTSATADYLRLTDTGVFHADPAATSVLTIAPVAAFGFLGSNPGSITVQGTELSVPSGQSLNFVAGDIGIGPGEATVNSPQAARISALEGQINLVSVESPGEVLTSNFQPAPTMTGGSISLGPGTLVDVKGNVGGTVHIRGGSLVMDDATILADTVDTRTSRVAIDINMKDNVSISDTRGLPAISSRTTGAGDAGDVSISSANMNALSNARPRFALIDTHTSDRGRGGSVTIQTSGDLTVTGNPIGQMYYLDSGMIGTAGGKGGNVTLASKNIQLANTRINSGDFLARNIGNEATGSGGNISISADTVRLTQSIIATDGFFTGRAGDLTITARDIQLNQFSQISLLELGGGGKLTITADRLMADSAQLESETVFGPGGGIHITAKVVELTNGTTVRSQTVGDGNAGEIRITATDHLTLADRFTDPNDPSTFSARVRPTGLYTNTLGDADVGTLGNAGAIIIKSPRVEINGGARINSSTQSTGRGGDVIVKATNQITISGERPTEIIEEALFGLGSTRASGIYTRTVGREFCSGTCGDAGNVTINTGSLALSGGAVIDSGTTTTGRGGSISVRGTDRISILGTMSDGTPGGVVSRTVGMAPESGYGGKITLNAGQSVTISDGASVSASSTGPGNAGNISVDAGQQLNIMGNSSVETEAAQASGGNIDIRAVDHIRLVNSTISASVVDGPGGGGNISIDPQVVALQNNSKILAQAADGQGGAITITTSLFLPDATSLVNANAGSGLNGTVTIQSPTSNLSGSLGPLTSKPSQAQALLTQRCAALVNNGQASSFVVAGREQLPSDPGGWLSSPLAFAALGESLDAAHAIAAAPATMPIVDHDRGMVSLRRLTPAGFLMANFADSEATGCRS